MRKTSVLVAITIGFMMCMTGLIMMPANVTAAAPQQWHNDQALSVSSALGVAVTGPDNQIYNFGGGIMTYSNHSVRYDPVTGSSTNLTPMPKALVSPVAAYFMGFIYVAGGRTTDGTTAGILYQYDIQHNSWSVRASMPKGVYRAMGVMDDSGKLWVAGGYNSTDAAATAAVQIYNTVTNSWSNGTSMPKAVFSGVGFKADGNLYVAGGTDGTSVLATVNAFPFSGTAWTAKAAMPSANAWMGVAMGKDGQAYVMGGSPSVGGSFTSAVSSTLIYNPDSNSWQSGPALPEKVYGPSTAATSDGAVWRIGGVTTSSSASRNVSSLNVMTVTDTVSPSTTVGTGRDMMVAVSIDMAFRPWPRSRERHRCSTPMGPATAARPSVPGTPPPPTSH